MRYLRLFSLFFFCLILSGCSNQMQQPGSLSKSVNYPLEIVDQTGYRSIIKQYPRSIISIVPSNTEILFALGLDKEVIAVTTNDNYPEQVLNLPKVGDFKINFEQVVSLQPDLVLASVSNGPDTIAKLRSLGLTVLVTDAKSIREIYVSIALIGEATNRRVQVDRLVAELDQKKLAVYNRMAMASRNKGKPRVWFELDSSRFTGGNKTFIDELINIAGGINIAHEQNGWIQLSNESIIASNPDVIINSYGGKDQISERSGWSHISAVKNDRIFDIDPDIISRPGPRLIEALEQIANFLQQ